MLNLILGAFFEGLATPLFAACVLPLYPGFLVYLGRRTKTNPFKMSLLVAAGTISFMFLLGLIFTTILRTSLTNVIEVASPIAFALLALVSLGLIFDFEFSKYIPALNTPRNPNPWKETFLFGFFFGFIVIPCNPAFIALFFAQVASVADFATNMLQFFSFAFGISFPLVLLGALSNSSSLSITRFITKHKRSINLISGTIMLLISLYYLKYVFGVIP